VGKSSTRSFTEGASLEEYQGRAPNSSVALNSSTVEDRSIGSSTAL